jgi:hypothetical protein
MYKEVTKLKGSKRKKKKGHEFKETDYSSNDPRKASL